MEGMQIPQNEIMASVLNKLFANKKYVYNIGMSSHGFCTSANNYERAVAYYKPQYVVIETGGVKIGEEQLLDVLNFNVKSLYDKTALNRKGIRGLMRSSIFYKLPFVKLIWSNRGAWKKAPDNAKALAAAAKTTLNTEPSDSYSQTLGAVLSRLRQSSEAAGVKLIIFYHPHLVLDKDGGVTATTATTPDNEYLTIFKNACEENGIYFLDMTERFLDEYQTNHILPHGFANGPVGAGHLNTNGHRMVAEELHSFINKIEGGAK
jgi:hypothetical protein